MSELVVGRVTFTPGPWTADIKPKRGNFAGAFAVEALDAGLVVCARAGVPSRASESAANARLIAAAPDLLLALKSCASVLAGDFTKNDLVRSLELARAAIAKAEGTDRVAP